MKWYHTFAEHIFWHTLYLKCCDFFHTLHSVSLLFLRPSESFVSVLIIYTGTYVKNKTRFYTTRNWSGERVGWMLDFVLQESSAFKERMNSREKQMRFHSRDASCSCLQLYWIHAQPLSQEIQYVWRGWDIKRIQKKRTVRSVLVCAIKILLDWEHQGGRILWENGTYWRVVECVT